MRSGGTDRSTYMYILHVRCYDGVSPASFVTRESTDCAAINVYSFQLQYMVYMAPGIPE